MGDNKVNMSLDDIIKMSKKNKPTNFPRKTAQRGGARGGGRGGRGARAGVGRGAKKTTSPRKVVVTRPQRGAANNRTGLRKGAVNAQTKKLVSQLVKKALKTRLGGSLARRPALANRGAIAVGRGVLATRVNRAGGGLGRVAARSRVIGRSRPVVSTVVSTARRGRGIRRGNTLYQDEIVRPVVVQQARPRSVVFERVVQAPQRVVQRVVQVPRQRQRVIMQRQRVIQRPQRERVIVVERQAPVQRVQRVIQRVQRPQRQQIQYVEARTQKNNNFRNAIGFGSSARRVQTVDRFEPSTTFITRQVIRRGRGFQNI